jgi:uncharacterized protein YkwD
MAWLVPAMALFLLAVGGCHPAQPAMVVPENYNTPIPLLPLTKDEVAMTFLVKKWAAEAGRAEPELDSGLTFVCRSLVERLKNAGADSVELFNNAEVQAELLRFGVADSAIRTQMAAALRIGDVEERLGADLRDEFVSGRYTHYGVGVARAWWPPSRFVVLIFSRRPVQLKPFPKQVEENDEVDLSGTLLGGLKDPKLYVSPPKGPVGELSLRTQPDGSFSATIAFRAGPGTYRVEIAGESSYGPEIVALMAVQAGQPDANAGEAAPLQVDEGTEEQAGLLVFNRINRDRKEAGVPPVTLYGPLIAIAQAHAEEMRQLQYAAHRSPTTGMVTDRANRAGIRWERIGENVAVNQSALSAHESLMESPAHRANVLDPKVNLVGVGVAFRDDGHGHRQVFLAQNFAALLPKGAVAVSPPPGE